MPYVVDAAAVRGLLLRGLVPIAFALVACLAGLDSPAWAETDLASLRHLHDVEPDDAEPADAPGIPFPPASGVRLVVDAPRPGAATVLIPDPSGGPASALPIEVPDPISMSVTGGADGLHRLFLLDPTHGELIDVQQRRGERQPRVRSHALAGLDLVAPAGLAADPASGELFILDAARAVLVVLDGGNFALAGEIPLAPGLAAIPDLRGLALDPASKRFYVLSPSAAEIYELGADGSFRALRPLSELGAFEALAASFAPSWDSTDDPETQHLYLATRDPEGGPVRVSEWTFESPTSRPRVNEPALLLQQASQTFAATAANDPSTLIRTVDGSSLSPPSPDSAGIAYQPSTDTMVMSDSEVNEMNLYEGVNVFELDRFGNLVDTFDTTHFSTEPTGVAINPANGFCFFSDDTGPRSVHVVDPGSDGVCLTSDDNVWSFTTQDFGSNDPEGVAYCQGSLFIIDGVNREYYELRPGNNGVFDGVSPSGDDQVTSCDTASLGVSDPEGITCNDATAQIYIIGSPRTEVAEVNRSCQIVGTIDVSAAPTDKPAGLGLAPSSVNPNVLSIWITDRGVDNNSNSSENDGLVFEMSLPSTTPGNTAPTVMAGPDQSITLGDGAPLQGSVVDDGVPGPFTSLWTQVGGSGGVSFADDSQPVTTATFSAPGSYTLRLTGNDGELEASDELTVNVAAADGTAILEIRIQDPLDDSEEDVASGAIDRNSSDLELVLDKDPQIVGLRFPGVGIPPGASILGASIQFKADQTDSPAGTVLTIEGDAAPTASPFLATNFDISSRARTTASVSWQPPAWPAVGAAGPEQRTPDLSAIVQELVDQPGWTSGNALAFLVTGSGKRVAESRDGDPPGAPLLQVTYREDDNTPPGVSITAPAGGTVVDVTDPVTFSGTAADAEDGDLGASLAWSSNLDSSIGSGAGFTTAALSVGTHVVTASVTDSQGAEGSDQITVIVNGPPLVAITAPADGAIVAAGTNVSFAATASDEDGDLAGALAWSSNLDGGIGSGGSFQTAGLSLGTHLITAQVADSRGLVGGAQITVTVNPNAPPVVSVTSPADGASVAAGSPVTFGATAVDPEDGDLGASLAWTSSLDGGLGNGPGFSTSALSVGTHTITASVNDSLGLPGSDAITLTVNPNLLPTVTITAPASGTTTDLGSPATFAATAWDPEDGDLAAGLAWVSSLDGPIGSGASFATSALSAGSHTVTASVPDGSGAVGSDQIAVDVNAPPAVSITAPGDGTVAIVGSSVSFAATATDEDGDLAGALAWTSSLDGGIGSGASFSTSGLSLGAHTITASVSDGRGLAGSDQIALTIAPDAPQVFEARVAAASDDAEQDPSGAIDLGSSDLELIADKGSDQTVGMRFQGVSLPPGAVVTQAYLQFTTDEVSSVATSLTLRGQAADDAPTFSTTSGDVGSRPTTAAAVAWSPPAWGPVGTAGPDQQSPDLAVVIQEIVSRPGWAAGHALVILVTGSGARVADSYDGAPNTAPLLHVEYTTDGNQFPAVDAGPDQSLTLPANTVLLAGSVSDDGKPDPPAAVTASWTQVGGPAGVAFSPDDAAISNATFPGPGAYTLRLTGDDSVLAASDDVFVTVIDPNAPLVFETRIAASADDAEQRLSNSNVNLTSSDLEMISDKGRDQLVGMRFQGVSIPPGAVITQAHVQFAVDEVGSDATSLSFRGQADDDAPAFANGSGNLSARPTTTSAMAWSPPAWTALGAAGADQRTPDLAAVIQEIVSRPGWTAGNSLVLLVSGSGTRNAISFNGSPADAPLLHVEYSAP